MSSLAFWAKQKASDENFQEQPRIEKLHFNYWYLECSNTYLPSLDVGLLVSSFAAIETLFIWLPAEICINDISDLACELTNASLLGAVFNDEYRVDSLHGKAFSVHLMKPLNHLNNDQFFLYELDVYNDVGLEPFDGIDGLGTILTIHIGRLHDLEKAADGSSDERCYFRLRIAAPTMQKAFVFGRNYKFSDALLHDTLSTTKLMDIRVNQGRSLPKTLCERIDSEGGYLPINALHFLLLTKDTTTVESDEYAVVRRLEKGIWDKYIPRQDRQASPEDIIAHHWKCKNELMEASYQWDVFIVLKLVHKSVKNIVIYLFFAMVLGIAANVISGFIG